MPRAFCVLVLNQNLSPSTMSWSVKYENYRVLVGSQENIDKVKEAIEAKMPEESSHFKVVLRTQAI